MTQINISARNNEETDKYIPSMEALVQVDGVLSGDDLFFSTSARLVRHC